MEHYNTCPKVADYLQNFLLLNMCKSQDVHKSVVKKVNHRVIMVDPLDSVCFHVLNSHLHI